VAGESLRFGAAGEPDLAQLPPALAEAIRAREPFAPAGPGQPPAQLHVTLWLEFGSSYSVATAGLNSWTELRQWGAGELGYQTSLLAMVPRAAVQPRGPGEEPRAADPVLGRTRPMEVAARFDRAPFGQPAHLYELLPQVAEAYDLNLVADAYWAQEMVPQRTSGEKSLPLHALLQRYVAPVAAWRKEGDFIQVRDHFWYEHRLAEIPERVAAGWTEHLRQRRRLTLEAAAELVLSLRDEQLAIFAPVVRERGMRLVQSTAGGENWSGLHDAGREILRAYGSLPPGQRLRLRRGEPLAYEELPRAARESFRKAYHYVERRGGSAAPSGGPVIGTFSLWTEQWQRLVVSADDREVREEHYLLDTNGARVGPPATSTSGSSPDTLPPVEGDQVYERVQFWQDYGPQQRQVFALTLPWAHPELRRSPPASGVLQLHWWLSPPWDRRSGIFSPPGGLLHGPATIRRLVQVTT
jgi:hypothetical protein